MNSMDPSIETARRKICITNYTNTKSIVEDKLYEKNPIYELCYCITEIKARK